MCAQFGWHAERQQFEQEALARRQPADCCPRTGRIESDERTPTAGVRKDVAMLGGYQSMEIDFVADQPGLSLLHCHQQIHMDYGLMLLLNTA